MAINNIADLFVATLEQAGLGCAAATGTAVPTVISMIGNTADLTQRLVMPH